jgi:nucleoid-associated protein YgaU
VASPRTIRPRKGLPSSRAVTGGLLVALAAIGTWWAASDVGQGAGDRYVVADPEAEPDPGPRQHRVQPGDHLWSIAEQAFTDHLGRQPAAADLDAYWRTVVDANPQLVDPDLLYPGEEVVVPPPAGNVGTST